MLIQVARGDQSSKSALIGFLAIGSFFGFVALIIPNMLQPWLSLLIYPFCTSGGVVVVALISQARKKRRLAQASAGSPQ
jgi:hypothetical protein